MTKLKSIFIKLKGKLKKTFNKRSIKLFICTVHFRNKKWIEIQNEHLNKYTNLDFRVIAITSEDIESSLPSHWIKIRDNGIKDHAKKLNIAGDIACQMAQNDDIIVFLDSDCFPIANWCDQVTKYLDEKRIFAVQRIENDGDPQPHPCFACMKAKTWKLIKGDWRAGYEWKNPNGKEVTDVGGNLLQIVNREKISWHKIHRSNTFNPHPLFFGIYGGIVYHHGAGSRSPISRADLREIKTECELNTNTCNNYKTLREERVIKNKEMSTYYLKEIMKGTNLLNLFQP